MCACVCVLDEIDTVLGLRAVFGQLRKSFATTTQLFSRCVFMNEFTRARTTTKTTGEQKASER